MLNRSLKIKMSLIFLIIWIIILFFTTSFNVESWLNIYSVASFIGGVLVLILFYKL